MIQPRAWFCTVHVRHDRTCIRSCSAKSIDRTGSGKGRSEWWRPAWRAGGAAFLQGAGAGMHACARPLFHTRCSAVRADWGLLLVHGMRLRPASAWRVCPEISQCRSWPRIVGSIGRPEHVLVYRCTFTTVHAHTLAWPRLLLL
jgi:hypothetical protein